MGAEKNGVGPGLDQSFVGRAKCRARMWSVREEDVEVDLTTDLWRKAEEGR